MARAARNGDGAAWEALYRSIYPRLRAFFVRRVGREHAEDGVSETMTRAVASIDRLDLAEGGFDAWVFGIARHVSVDHHRRHDRIRRHLHHGRLLSADEVVGATPVDHDLVVEDDHAAIRSHFAELTDTEREVLELRVIAGLWPRRPAKPWAGRPARSGPRNAGRWPIFGSWWSGQMPSPHLTDDDLLDLLSKAFPVEEWHRPRAGCAAWPPTWPSSTPRAGGADGYRRGGGDAQRP